MDGYAWVDVARDGESNMAIDRLLLETAERQQCALMRLYRWSEPTLSLGHFQATVDRGIHSPSAQLPTVLRASGGGAIVHHREWTYAIAIPVGRNKVGAATQLYDLVHDALVAGLRSWGWDASKWTPGCAATPSASAYASPLPSSTDADRALVPQPGCGQTTTKRHDAAFLCFQRRSCGDIVCAGAKVVGSAQRRLGSSVLQHGSILCSKSEFAPELPGLNELPREGTIFASDAADDRRRRFSEKTELKSENFGYDVLSWVVAPLFRSLNVSWTETVGPPDLFKSWSRADAKRGTIWL
jgi:lipoate-protein ligase A